MSVGECVRSLVDCLDPVLPQQVLDSGLRRMCRFEFYLRN